MSQNSFFSGITSTTQQYQAIIDQIRHYSKETNSQIYVINVPLGDDKHHYSYQENAIVILSPKHKIIFLDLADNQRDFEIYCDDFIEDLGYISDKYDYKEYIGRPKEWNQQLIAQEKLINQTTSSNKIEALLNNLVKKKDYTFDVQKLFDKNKLDSSLYRKGELLISLLIGSVNNLSKIGGVIEPQTLLEKIKNKIVLFDADQTMFIYQESKNPVVYIQGLAGTGKTELLLHKLKELYTRSDVSRIFFTCKNVALGRELNKRIPEFFNSMKVEKQIKKNERLWVNHAWGSFSDVNSGLYRYICHYYNIPFYNFGQVPDFDTACKYALELINKNNKDEFRYAFDFVLVDESQDFPKSFIDLCQTITKEKVFVAGDLFQDIFGEQLQKNIIEPDLILNKCYRTDPRTLMFAQSIGMGLFENPHLRWLKDETWNDIGYSVQRVENKVFLSRQPIRRFEDLKIENYESMLIVPCKNEFVSAAIDILEKIKEQNPTVSPDDIGIVYLSNYNSLCEFSNELENELKTKLNWNINRAYENKQKVSGQIFITNQNHIKGLEFPFLICLSFGISDDTRYRNTIYTMLTRSFLQSYLVIEDNDNLKPYIDGLKSINENHYIITTQPTQEDLKKMDETIIQHNKKQSLSLKDMVLIILDDLGIPEKLPYVLKILQNTKHANNVDEFELREFILEIKDHL